MKLRIPTLPANLLLVLFGVFVLANHHTMAQITYAKTLHVTSPNTTFAITDFAENIRPFSASNAKITRVLVKNGQTDSNGTIFTVSLPSNYTNFLRHSGNFDVISGTNGTTLRCYGPGPGSFSYTFTAPNGTKQIGKVVVDVNYYGVLQFNGADAPEVIEVTQANQNQIIGIPQNSIAAIWWDECSNPNQSQTLFDASENNVYQVTLNDLLERAQQKLYQYRANELYFRIETADGTSNALADFTPGGSYIDKTIRLIDRRPLVHLIEIFGLGSGTIQKKVPDGELLTLNAYHLLKGTPQEGQYMFKGWYDTTPGGAWSTHMNNNPEYTFTATYNKKLKVYFEKVNVIPTALTLEGTQKEIIFPSYSPHAYISYSVTPNAQLPSGAIYWVSSDPSVASVDETLGRVTPHKIGTTTITATTFNGLSASIEVIVKAPEVAVTSIYGMLSATLKVGETQKLMAEPLPNEATDKRLTWEVGNPQIASIDQQGNVRGLQVGETYVRVTSVANPSVSLQTSIKVIENQPPAPVYTSVQSVVLTNISTGKVYGSGDVVELKVNDKIDLKAIISPDNASLKSTEWKTDDASKLSLVPNLNQATITANGVTETAGVWVDVVDMNNKLVASEFLKIKVTQPDVVITIIDENNAPIQEFTLLVGQSKRLSATVANFQYGSSVNFAWSIDNTAIAQVGSGDGIVKAKAVGETRVIFTTTDRYGKVFTQEAKVIVQAPPVVAVQNVSIEQGNQTLGIGETFTFSANVTPPEATNKQVTWSTNSNAVSVNKNGVVTANEIGIATITASTTDGNHTAQVEVFVNKTLETDTAPFLYDLSNIKKGEPFPIRWVDLQAPNATFTYQLEYTIKSDLTPQLTYNPTEQTLIFAQSGTFRLIITISHPNQTWYKVERIIQVKE